MWSTSSQRSREKWAKSIGMIVLTLHRDSPLSRAEIEALPPGCYPVLSGHDVIARAELDLPPAHMIRFAVEMARAIPDAHLEAQEQASAEGGAVLRAASLTDPFRTWMPALFRSRLPSAAALSSMDVTPIVDPGASRTRTAEPTKTAPREPLIEPPTAVPGSPSGDLPAGAVAAPSLPPELSAFMDTLLTTSSVQTGGFASLPPSSDPERSASSEPQATPPAPPVASPSRSEEQAKPAGPDPWVLLESGKIPAAREAFKGHTLDIPGQQKVREMLISSTPSEIAQGCWISRLTRWKAASPLLNRVLFSGEASVRAEAIRALGALSGPSIEPSLHMLLRDSVPEVRLAAQRAILQIQRRRS